MLAEFLINASKVQIAEIEEIVPDTYAATKTWDGGGDGTSWESGNNWNPNGVPGVTDDVLLASTDSVQISGSTTINSLTMRSDSQLTFSYDSDGSPLTIDDGDLDLGNNAVITTATAKGYRIHIIVQTGDMLMASNSQIIADSGGYDTDSGVAPGASGVNYGAGGGHAGAGGDTVNGDSGGGTYGSATAPNTLGSGGGSGTGTGGAGGGAIRLDVNGIMELSGSTISADGQTISSGNGGGGAGGSVWLIASEINGDGTESITAEGGDVQSKNGGGGGGYVRMTCDINTFDPENISVIGGEDTVGAGAGGDGVISYGTGCGQKTWDGGGDGVNWESGNNWNPDGVPSSDDNVFVTGSVNVDINATTTVNTLTIGTGSDDPRIYFDYDAVPSSNRLYVDGGDTDVFFLKSGAIISTTANSSTQAYRGFIQITDGNGIIDGDINVDSKGFTGGNGTGAGSTVSGIGTGGTHGGEGGGPSPSTSVIDTVSAPNMIGSGGSSDFATGGSGGGVFLLWATGGDLEINGDISANGQTVTSGIGDPGGGAGGSIWITAENLTGSGSASANGGEGRNNGGGGGGGRISVQCSVDCSDTFEANVTAYGGDDNASDFRVQRYGGAGTVYLEDDGETTGDDLIIDNNGVGDDVRDTREIGRTLGSFGGTTSADNVIISHEGNYELRSGDTLSYGTLMDWGSVGGGSITDEGGTFDLISGSAPLVVPLSTSTLYADTTRSYTTGSVSGTVTHSNNTDTESIKINQTFSGALTINASGSYDVTARGYEETEGPGGGSSNGGSGGGGGYGGDGGDAGAVNGGTGGIGSTGGDGYGATSILAEVETPYSIGSGGGSDINPGGRGGGAIRLSASGTMTINGSIIADGQDVPTSTNDPGGGAGGGIDIHASDFDGTGTVHADGGDSQNNGGGGGGGRIHMEFTGTFGSNSFDLGSPTVYGGASENFPNERFGGAGTYLYSRTSWTTLGVMRIDNNDQFETGDDTRIGRTPFDTGTYNWRRIYVQNGGNVDLQSGSVFTYGISQNWNNQGRYTDNGGTFSNVITSGALSIPSSSKLFSNTTRTYTGASISGILTHSNNVDTEVNKLDHTYTGPVLVNSGGSINVDGRGYYPAEGTGGGSAANGISGGGGYGGDGGDGGAVNGSTGGIGSTGGDAYGSPSIVSEIKAPSSIGSGGGNDNTAGGRGGGSITISTNNVITVNGPISANGQDMSATSNDVGGGAGGSIYLDAQGFTRSGSETISAIGGGGNNNGGGGGGGRVAIEYTTSSSFPVDSSSDVLVYGGASESQPNERFGGAGTHYYVQDSQSGVGNLIINNNNLDENGDDTRIGRTPVDGSITLADITLEDDGNIDVQSGANITATLVQSGGQITDNGGTWSPISGGGSFTVASGTKFFENTSRTFTSFQINNTGILTHSNNIDTPATYRLNIDVTSMNIAGGGEINVDGRGFYSALGDSPGSTSGGEAGGGGYGGEGGDTTDLGTAGAAYGKPTIQSSIFIPINVGNGGGTDVGAGGRGGGSIEIDVADIITLDGDISANGSNGGAVGDTGGGSGGSIYIDGVLTGEMSDASVGTMSANGGSGAANGGGGGGGRIYVEIGSFDGTPTGTAYGGSSSNSERFGGAGTVVFLELGSGTNGDLLIDNNSQDALNDLYYGKTPLVSSSATVTFDDITVENDGHLDLTSDTTISASTVDVLGGNISDNGGTFSPISGGGALTIESTGKLYANTTRTFSSITNNGVISHTKNTTAETYKINLTTTGAFTVSGTGSIDVSGHGNSSGNGTGPGVDSGNYASGAGHGGDGGDATGSSGSGGDAYDSTTNPVNIGSGGGPEGTAVGGDGGGAVILSVGSDLTLNGPIDASASNSWASGPDYGGGAGGTVNLSITGSFSGTADITADGSSAQESNAGAGAGGRIHYSCGSGSWSGSTSVDPGTIGNTGGTGTIDTTGGCPFNSAPDVDSIYINTSTSFTNLSPLTLTANTTTFYSIHGVVSDDDGYADIDQVDAVLYRSGATGGASCSADNNDCYRVTGCSLGGGGGTTINYSCIVNLEYFTDPTDTGAYGAQTWNVRISVDDGTDTTDDDSYTNEVSSMSAIYIPGSIDHGTLVLGATNDGEALTTYNAGNVDVDIDLSMSSAISCTLGTIPIANNKYGTKDLAYASLTYTLSSTPTTLDVLMPQQTNDGVQVSDIIYWGIQIPSTEVGGTCSGVVTATAN